MNVKFLTLGMLFLLTSCATTKKHTFSHANPETKGYSSEKLEELRQHLENSGSSAMLLMVDGEIIFEWGETTKKHLVHSIRKALLNSLYGIAIGNGQIDTSMTLRALGIEDIDPGLNEQELDARIADLLRSRSGVYHNAAAVSQGMLKKMPKRNTHKPGEHYYYNNWDFNTLGAILERQTGKKIYDLFYEQIAKPVGMHHFKGKYVEYDAEADDAPMPQTDGYYKYERSKSKYPAYHFRMSAVDLALYGQLYLDYGNWNGKQIISKEWIDVSTQPYSVYSPKYGNAYGMLWRVRVPSENTVRNSFYHTGVGIHMLGVYPDAGLVLVHRVDTEADFDYQERDFYKMLRLVFGAKIQ